MSFKFQIISLTFNLLIKYRDILSIWRYVLDKLNLKIIITVILIDLKNSVLILIYCDLNTRMIGQNVKIKN